MKALLLGLLVEIAVTDFGLKPFDEPSRKRRRVISENRQELVNSPRSVNAPGVIEAVEFDEDVSRIERNRPLSALRRPPPRLGGERLPDTPARAFREPREMPEGRSG